MPLILSSAQMSGREFFNNWNHQMYCKLHFTVPYYIICIVNSIKTMFYSQYLAISARVSWLLFFVFSVCLWKFLWFLINLVLFPSFLFLTTTWFISWFKLVTTTCSKYSALDCKQLSLEATRFSIQNGWRVYRNVRITSNVQNLRKFFN